MASSHGREKEMQKLHMGMEGFCLEIIHAISTYIYWSMQVTSSFKRLRILDAAVSGKTVK